jgi:propanediol utilization protein
MDGVYMKVKVGVSNHHIHLNEDDFNKLFACVEVTRFKNISQYPQYTIKETVKVVGNNNKELSLRVIMPIREYSQVELSITDCYNLDIKNYVINESSNVDSSPLLKVYYNDPTNYILVPVNVAKRHLHLNSRENINASTCCAIVNSRRSGIIKDIVVRKSSDAVNELHLDLDEANAFDLHNGDDVEIDFECKW